MARDSGDAHPEYAILVGRSGGSTYIGGTAAGDDLILQSTSNATKGDVRLGVSAGEIVKIGASDSTLGFFAVTPSARASAYTQTYATADKTNANPTGAALTVTTSGAAANGTLAAVGALTAADLTDNSGGSATTTLAAITGGGANCENATKNAIASIAAQTDALFVDLGAIRTLFIDSQMEYNDQITKLAADIADVKQLVNSVIDDLQAYGLLA